MSWYWLVCPLITLGYCLMGSVVGAWACWKADDGDYAIGWLILGLFLWPVLLLGGAFYLLFRAVISRLKEPKLPKARVVKGA